MNLKKQKEKERRRARKLADEAWQAAEDGNLDLAEKIIRRAVAVQQDNPVLWDDQGAILVLRGKEDEAEKSFRNALRLVPTYAEALRPPGGAAGEARLARTGRPLAGTGRHPRPHQRRLRRHAASVPRSPGRRERPRPLPPPEPEPAPVAPLALDLPAVDWPARVDALDWGALGESLTREGCVLIRADGAHVCAAAARPLRPRRDVRKEGNNGPAEFRPRGLSLLPRPRARTGRGAAPRRLPARRARGQPLAGVAARVERFPEEWEAFRAVCREAGQTTPTPILLRYGPGGFNALHRDLRGSVFFPMQMAVVLSPRHDQAADGFGGGDFLFADVPERPKSRRRKVAAGLGDAILFCTRDRLVPIGGVHGLQPVKHGVAEITAGTARCPRRALPRVPLREIPLTPDPSPR